MGFISEIRYPTTWYAKLVIAIISLAVFGVLAVGSISAYFVYRIGLPPQSHPQPDLQNLPGHPQPLSYNVPGGGSRDGWFFPGLKSAPTIMLCPPASTGRAELLTLASALQDQQYNVFLFDFSAPSGHAERATLGYREVAELQGAMNAVASRGDVDPNRFGLWGANLGGYVALSQATNDPRVRAIAVESIYDSPDEMAGLFVANSGLGSQRLITRVTQMEFRWINSQYRAVSRLSVRVSKLSGVAQLYIESSDEPMLAATTSNLFRASPPPHELVVLPKGNYAGMLDDEKRSYENRIVSFFLGNLPAVGRP